MGQIAKNFLPWFSLCGREPERRRYLLPPLFGTAATTSSAATARSRRALRWLGQIVPRFFVRLGPSGYGRACPMQTYGKGSSRLRVADAESQVDDFRRADPALPHRPDRQRSVAFGKTVSSRIGHQLMVTVAWRRQVE